MADVFISYCREDVAAADRRGMERVLTEAGFSVWRDSQTASGSQWTDEVQRQLRDAKAVLVIWSSNSWQSHWVRQEAFYAYMSGKLVPQMLKERPAALDELPFSALQTRQNDAKGIAATIDAIRQLVG